jgi:hypothetical protein
MYNATKLTRTFTDGYRAVGWWHGLRHRARPDLRILAGEDRTSAVKQLPPRLRFSRPLLEKKYRLENEFGPSCQFLNGNCTGHMPHL